MATKFPKFPGRHPDYYNVATTTDKRLNIGVGAVAHGWPSTGGRYDLGPVGAFELEYLGLDRFSECERNPNPDEEDAFCLRLRRLGARFCPYSHGSRTHRDEKDEDTWLGWPAEEDGGGVWVLKANRSESYRRQVGRISLAKDMGERCKAIEMCGGVFFKDVEACEEARGLAQEYRSGRAGLWISR